MLQFVLIIGNLIILLIVCVGGTKIWKTPFSYTAGWCTWGKKLTTVPFSASRSSTNCSWDQNPNWSSQVCISLGHLSKLRLHQASRWVVGDHITAPPEVIVIPACPSMFAPWPTALEKHWSYCMYRCMYCNNSA